jgi:signal transduction histidine kinase
MNSKSTLYRFFIIVGALLPLLLVLPSLVRNRLPDSSLFVPHGQSYGWDPTLLMLHAGSDGFLGISYIVIAGTLSILLFRANRDLPFKWIILSLGVFMVACGVIHLLEVVTLWNPLYWLSGVAKLVTAVASVAIAIVLPTMIPRLTTLVTNARLSENRKREVEVLSEKLKEFDKLKSDFFANIGHELRTPLALILGPAEKLLATDGLQPGTRSDLLAIERNARSLLKHVNDLLDISKLESGKMELDLVAADLVMIVRIAVSHFESLAAERSITLRLQAPARLPARLDVGKIERIIVNLLSNAFKFTPDGGTIFCRVEDEGDQAIIDIRDSGPGIPTELREKVFERFRQVDGGAGRRPAGTGLGLSIAREFARLHDGTISIAEAPEGGADLQFVLPIRSPAIRSVPVTTSVTGIARQAAEELRPGAEQELVRDADGRVDANDTRPLVLVAEDDREMNSFIRQTLSESYRVVTSLNGAEAYGMALTLAPDLVVTDVTMPRVSGEHLVRLIRQHHELDGIPILLLTARASDDLASMLREGVQDYLIKPFLEEELLTRAGNLVTIRRVREALRDGDGARQEDVATMASAITENHRALRLALEKKDRFLVALGHELRAPLTPVLTATQFLAEEPTMNPESRRLLDVIDRNVKIEARLIDDLLDLTKLASGGLVLDVRGVDLHDSLRNVVESCRQEINERDLALHLALDAQSTGVRGDPARLRQIFRNILKNAAKFTPSGGSITVITRNDAQRRVIVEVIDSGIGIEPEMLTRVFDAFEQGEQEARRFGGLGLGLSISRMLVELHGGTIRASSRGRHRGATITVVLPVA